jgi:hypothetical protein
VEFEDPAEAFATLEAEGIRVGRIQVSSALEVSLPEGADELEDAARKLAAFADPVYLHQVVETGTHGRRQYPDLPEALRAIQPQRGQRSWRIHFHVPVFASRYAAFGSTQDFICRVFRLLEQRRFTRHLEIETYTWSVLPPEFRQPLLESIEREYRWVLGELCAKPPSSISSA